MLVIVPGCKWPRLIGDGYCNDETNNLHCNFDGGDCCYSCVSTLFCLDCECLTGDDGENDNTVLSGDGYCHDDLNTLICIYDGGDCCGSCINTDFCTNCTCKDDMFGNGVSNALIGNGFCNDETNHLDCDYDGGDCCLHSANFNECSECICHHEEPCAAGILPSSIGDGFCNDELNNIQCYYDGLDCCLSPVDETFCSNCSCHGELIFLQ